MDYPELWLMKPTPRDWHVQPWGMGEETVSDTPKGDIVIPVPDINNLDASKLQGFLSLLATIGTPIAAITPNPYDNIAVKLISLLASNTATLQDILDALHSKGMIVPES